MKKYVSWGNACLADLEGTHLINFRNLNDKYFDKHRSVITKDKIKSLTNDFFNDPNAILT